MVSENIDVNVNVMQLYTRRISMANVNINIMQLYTSPAGVHRKAEIGSMYWELCSEFQIFYSVRNYL